MISHFFIDRPIFATVLSIVIVIVGVVAATQLPVAQYPDVAPPTVQVTATYPGANAKTTADNVATPIEQEVNGVERMLYMSSKCTNDGQMNLDVTFELGTNLDTAQVLVQNRVAVAEAKLPEEVKRIGVTTKKKSPSILLCVNLVSAKRPDGSFYYDQLYLSNFATLSVKDDLARIKGVGDVAFLGPRDYSMRVWLDPDKLAARDLTASDVINAVREQNRQVAAGRLGQPPVPTGRFGPISAADQHGRPADLRRAVRKHRAQDERRRRRRPFQGCRSRDGPRCRWPHHRQRHRAGREELRRQQLSRRRAIRHAGRVPIARLERARHGRRDSREDGRTQEPLSRRRRLSHLLRHDGVRPRVDHQRDSHADRSLHPGLYRRARVPAELAGHDHSDGRRAGVADRHICRDGHSGLFAQ